MCRSYARMPLGLLTSSNFPSAEVVVKDVRCARQAARPAHHRNALPDAYRGLARSGRFGKIEMDVVSHGEVQLAVAVIIDESAAGTPFLSGSGHSGLFGHFEERAITLIVKEAIFP